LAFPRFTDRAEADLLDIWMGLAIHSVPAADRAVDRLRGACQLLAEFPRLGRAHPEIASDARVHVVDRWLVLYRLQGETVIVRRVIDGRQDRSRLTENGDHGR
jgi:toxin ParE1/3/4